jgi:hypothetical protein
MNKSGVLLAFCTVVWGASSSIKEVDFKNFAYPFIFDESVPQKPRWMPMEGATFIPLRGGKHGFECRAAPCPLLTLNQITFGNIEGLPQTSALVVANYLPKGTATLQYLYIVALRSGRPQVVAWLKTGSPASMGFRRVSTERGDLVLVMNSPERHEESITVRYRWRDGFFQQIGSPVLAGAAR